MKCYIYHLGSRTFYDRAQWLATNLVIHFTSCSVCPKLFQTEATRYNIGFLVESVFFVAAVFFLECRREFYFLLFTFLATPATSCVFAAARRWGQFTTLQGLDLAGGLWLGYKVWSHGGWDRGWSGGDHWRGQMWDPT